MSKPILLLVGLAIFGLFIAACGDDATPAPTSTPQPTATPIDVGAITSTIQQTIQQSVSEAVKGIEIDTGPDPLSRQEIQGLVQTAVAAAVPETASKDEIETLVRSVVTAATAAAATREDVEGLISEAVAEAATGGPTPLSALEVSLIVEKALKALPTVTPAPTPTPVPTATPAPVPTPQPTATPLPSPTPVVVLAKGIRGGNPPLQMGWAVSNWSPHECDSSAFCLTPLAPMYNGLIEYDPETPDRSDIRGDLATGWTVSSDGLSYTFQLNENARWHDGTPVTAADVVFSLDSMVDPDEIRLRTGDIKPFYKSSEAMDDHTVRVDTKFTAAVFLPFLATEWMKIIPKHHVETGVDMALESNILGSGPFQLLEHDKDVSVEYIRNEDYFKEGRPYWDGMRYFVIINPGSAFAAFKAGQVLTHAHPTNGLSGSQNDQLAREQEGKGKGYFAGPTSIIWTTMNYLKEPFTDVRVRRAFALAAHRQPFVETFSRGRDRLGGAFPPGFWFSLSEEELAEQPGYRETRTGEKHPDDLAEANRLLAEAGFPNGEGLSLTINTLIFAELPDMAVLMADQLRRFLNIEITVNAMEGGVWFPKVMSGDFELDAAGYSHTIMDPHDILNGIYIGEGTQNWVGWSHPRIEEIFVAQARELDQAKRKALISEAETILLEEDNPHILLYWTMRGMYVDNRIWNFNPPVGLSDALKMEHLWCDPAC